MRNNKNKYLRNSSLCAMFAGLMLSANGHAEFVLDWTGDADASGFFTSPGTTMIHGDLIITGQTPFVYETTPDGQYYHMIVGDPASDFAQEVYIQRGFTPNYQGGSSSAAAGTGIGDGNGGVSGNGVDPLGVVSTNLVVGNATGNPTRIQMREIHNSGDFSMDFSKNIFLEKPSISMEINSTDFQTQFIIDASGITYDDATTPAIITNTMQIIDANIPASSATFDMSTDAQNSNVTAGRYTYTPGTGPGGSRGTYTYSADTFNLGNIHWADYFDSSLANPWAYTDNRP